MSYIKEAGRQEGCIFCALPALGASHDRESLILLRGELAYVIMNKFPYNSGHLMVAPFRHGGAYDELTPDEHAEVSALTARCVGALKGAYGPEGFNIGVNQGRAAGAGIVDHLHMHVVPRWAGDTNYMTTIGETKVLPETLDETYAKLKPLLG
jgi:ATP adenylyltransferase